MRRQLVPALGMTIVLTVLTGIIYPLLVLVVGQAAFPHQADGSLISSNGTVVGSSLLGQRFTKPEYFHPRPSAAGDGYDALASSASNLGPGNTDLLAAIEQRTKDYRKENGLAAGVEVPVDAVTASGSGLDPGISIANARIQATRVAHARGLAVAAVLRLVDQHTTDRALGFLGEKVVNVLALNLDLDRQG